MKEKITINLSLIQNLIILFSCLQFNDLQARDIFSFDVDIFIFNAHGCRVFRHVSREVVAYVSSGKNILPTNWTRSGSSILDDDQP